MRASVNERPPKGLNWILILFLLGNLLNSFGLILAYLATHISPNSFTYLSYFGLAYPIWLTIALLFIIFWIFFRPKLIWISIFSILIGFNHLRNFFAFTFVKTELVDSFQVVSYNVHIFNLYDLENRERKRDEIFSFLKAEDANIYCFQEFYHQEGNRNFVTKDSLIDLLETPYYHERYTHELTNKRYFGVATFSKFPIISKGEIPFDNDPNNFCIYSDLVKGEDTIRVFNAHIGSIRLQDDDYRFFDETVGDDQYRNNEVGQRILMRLKVAYEKRAIQAEKVATAITESPYPVVLCGDLNDTPVSYCYRQFSSLLNDAFVQSGNGIGKTYIGVVPSNRIDYIFYSDAFKSANFETHALDCSDHRPITCELGKEDL